jgi:hypothetical protein
MLSSLRARVQQRAISRGRALALAWGDAVDERVGELTQDAWPPAKPSSVLERELLRRALATGVPGCRSDTGLWLACQLRDNGFLEGEARRILRNYQRLVPHKDPSYKLKEAMASVTQAYRRAPRQPWTFADAASPVPNVTEGKRIASVGIGTSNAIPTPSPSVTSGKTRWKPEMRQLLELDEQSLAPKVAVEAPSLPPKTPPRQTAIYRAMLNRLALRMGAPVAEDRPLPYSASEAAADAAATGLPTDERNASRALRWLQDHDLIWCTGTLPPRGYPNGTKCWLPGPKSGSPPDDPRCIEAAGWSPVREGVQQPEVKVIEQPSMGEAVAASAG